MGYWKVNGMEIMCSKECSRGNKDWPVVPANIVAQISYILPLCTSFGCLLSENCIDAVRSKGGGGAAMRRYRKYNPKRRLKSHGTHSELELAKLAGAVKYTGNPEHKRNPGDFGLSPPSRPRRDKTLCDAAGILTRTDALKYLRLGLKRGAVSEQFVDGWPKIVWAVTEDGIPLEAQRDGTGNYHGYPMPPEDPMVAEIKKFWARDG